MYLIRQFSLLSSLFLSVGISVCRGVFLYVCRSFFSYVFLYPAMSLFRDLFLSFVMSSLMSFVISLFRPVFIYVVLSLSLSLSRYVCLQFVRYSLSVFVSSVICLFRSFVFFVQVCICCVSSLSMSVLFLGWVFVSYVFLYFARSSFLQGLYISCCSCLFMLFVSVSCSCVILYVFISLFSYVFMCGLFRYVFMQFGRSSALGLFLLFFSLFRQVVRYFFMSVVIYVCDSLFRYCCMVSVSLLLFISFVRLYFFMY